MSAPIHQMPAKYRQRLENIHRQAVWFTGFFNRQAKAVHRAAGNDNSTH